LSKERGVLKSQHQRRDKKEINILGRGKFKKMARGPHPLKKGRGGHKKIGAHALIETQLIRNALQKEKKGGVGH